MKNTKASSQNLWPSTQADKEYEVALNYLSKGLHAQAERWLGYAVHRGHVPAMKELNEGIKKEIFQPITNRIRIFSIELLENFITPQPAEEQINHLEKILHDYLSECVL